MPNRLAGETSPYLLQHADNPVAWRPWDDEALAEARRDDKPILLSIGYSACHWCHVMAHESFEDPDVAAAMNADFVNIKVDREERPDLDQIYQTAHALMTRRSGGWPLTMFLTPDGAPFFGGTYFPKEGRYGLPGFRDLLPRVAAAYRERGADIAEQAAQLKEALASLEPVPAAGEALPASAVAVALAELKRRFDPVHGGFGARAQVSARDRSRLLPARARTQSRRRGAGDGPPHARADGRRRHSRSAGRRLLPLQRRRRVDDSAFREDALRQRAAARALRGSRASDRRRPIRKCGARHRRLDDARNARARWRLFLEPRRRQRGRGRQVLRLEPGRSEFAARAGGLRGGGPALRARRTAEFRRPRLEPPRECAAPRRCDRACRCRTPTRLPDSTPRRQRCSPRARSECGRASTTRYSRRGTPLPSRDSRARRAPATCPTGPTSPARPPTRCGAPRGGTAGSSRPARASGRI